MRLRFRSTVLGILIAFILITVVPIAVVSYRNARFTADDLSAQLLDQTSARVEQQVEALVERAVDRAAIDRRLLEAGRLDAGDFAELIGYWLEVLAETPELSSVFIGLPSTGESTGVSRLGGRLSIWQSNLDPATGRLDQRDFWPEGYPTTPYAFDPGKPAPDIRTRPWYVAARDARRSIWTETYPFLGVAGAAPTQGVTHATPVYRDGRLIAVISADFDLRGLGGFLGTLQIGRTGFAFVVEERAGGGPRLIAHPDPAHLGSDRAISDGRVRALMTASRGGAVAQIRFDDGGTRYIGSYRPIGGDGAPRWMIGIVVPEADVMARVDRSRQLAVAVAIGALLLAIGFGVYVARQVARPLEGLSKEMAAIGELALDARPAIRSVVLEVDRVAVATERMKAGLRSFQKYVPSDLVRTLLASEQEAGLGGERRRVTIYFSDIVGFTTFSERMTPEALVEQLRAYLGALSAAIHDGGGTVDKFIGDAIMAFWGAPSLNPRHALDACAAALENQRVLARLNPGWAAAGKPAMHTCIGLNTGEVVVGNIGSETRLSYTVIGDAVNLASRIEGLNREYGTRILLGEATVAEAGDPVVVRPIDWVAVRGRSQVQQIYELLGLRGEVDAAVADLAGAHAEGLARYRAQDWDGAIARFARVVEVRPDDGPARLMIRRCEAYRAAPPGDDWDGVHRARTK